MKLKSGEGLNILGVWGVMEYFKSPGVDCAISGLLTYHSLTLNKLFVRSETKYFKEKLTLMSLRNFTWELSTFLIVQEGVGGKKKNK